MYNYVKALQEELDNSKLAPIFEIVVTDKLTGETEWVHCDIFFQGNSLVAHRDPVSSGETRSKYIATSKIVCDDCYGLDSHLSELYEQVQDDILNGDLYELV